MSNVPVASCGPRENSSAGFGARSMYCAVALADQTPGQILNQPGAGALRREPQIALHRRPHRRRVDRDVEHRGRAVKGRRHATQPDLFDAARNLRLGRAGELEFIEDVAGNSRILVRIEQAVERVGRVIARGGQLLMPTLHADRGGECGETQVERHELDFTAAFPILVGEGLTNAVGARIGRIGKSQLVVFVVGVAGPVADRVDRGA